MFGDNDISVEGNKGGDTLEIKVLEDGRIRLIVGHCCVREIRHIVPVEFITSALTRIVLDNGGVTETMKAIGWPEEFTEQLVSQIEKVS